MVDVGGGDLGVSSRALTVLEIAGVVGALSAGTLSDRFGRINVLAVLTIVAPLLLILFLFAPTWLIVPLLLLLGYTALAPTPVLLAMVQDSFSA